MPKTKNPKNVEAAYEGLKASNRRPQKAPRNVHNTLQERPWKTKARPAEEHLVQYFVHLRDDRKLKGSLIWCASSTPNAPSSDMGSRSSPRAQRILALLKSYWVLRSRYIYIAPGEAGVGRDVLPSLELSLDVGYDLSGKTVWTKSHNITGKAVSTTQKIVTLIGK